MADAGGSVLTHAFGAFFGLGMTLGMGMRARHIPEKNRLTNYTSDTFALIGMYRIYKRQKQLLVLCGYIFWEALCVRDVSTNSL